MKHSLFSRSYLPFHAEQQQQQTRTSHSFLLSLFSHRMKQLVNTWNKYQLLFSVAIVL